jgi:hypothetical protein
MTQVAGYHVTADRGDRIALARLVNDLEQLPNPEGGSGGSFSPRLEAELIKMLTRPGQREVISPVERLQSATLFGLLGMFLGAIGLAAVLGLSQLLGKIQQQSDSIQVLAGVVEQTATRQRNMTEDLIERAGKNPVDFEALLERTRKAREEADKRLENARVNVDSLTNDLKIQKKDNLRFAQALAVANEKVEEFEKDAKELVELRVKNSDLEKEKAIREQKLIELGPWLESEPGKAALAREHELRSTRYWAYSGWTFTVLLGVGLAAMYLLLKPLPNAPLENDVDRPTHRIE